LYALVVFAGVLLVNLGQVEIASIKSLLLGAAPVLVAAFLYPLGNQLVWEAKRGRRGLPKLAAEVVDNAFAKVFLLSAGSVPFWLVLALFAATGAPTTGQLINVAVVAGFGGVIASSLFLYARNQARSASQVAAVDATQSGEVIFALGGEILLLGASLPNAIGVAGMVVAGLGLIAFVRHEH
jgi:drug/metabolite transporter (DMT)-like permease